MMANGGRTSGQVWAMRPGRMGVPTGAASWMATSMARAATRRHRARLTPGTSTRQDASREGLNVFKRGSDAWGGDLQVLGWASVRYC